MKIISIIQASDFLHIYAVENLLTQFVSFCNINRLNLISFFLTGYDSMLSVFYRNVEVSVTEYDLHVSSTVFFATRYHSVLTAKVASSGLNFSETTGVLLPNVIQSQNVFQGI